jgi:chemotaxis-related protein WspB
MPKGGPEFVQTEALTVLRFDAGGQLYGLDLADVLEVVPAVPLRVIPGAPKEVAGVFHYRGGMVPVLDATKMLTGAAAGLRFSTRIVLVKYPDARGQIRTLGLLVEGGAQGLTQVEGGGMSAGIRSTGAPYLSKLAAMEDSTIQLIQIQYLIPEALHESLFTES